MSALRVSPALAIFVVLSAACGSDDPSRRFKPPQDAGRPADAGEVADASSSADAEAPADTGAPDLGLTPDAGVAPDAAAPDAGPLDFGVTPDAGGIADAGVTPDAGGLDAMTPDASAGDASISDAGVADGGADGGLVDGGGAMDGGVPDGGMGPPRAPTTFDAAGVASALAAAQCRNLSRCVPAYYDFNRTTEAACVTEQTRALTGYYRAVGAALTATTASYDATRLQSCLDALTTTSTCTLGVLDATCDFVTGNVTRGGGCTLTEECAAGDFCDASAVNGCGTCSARAAPGQSCASAACAADAECFDVGGSPTCVATNLGPNAACGTVATGLCRGELQCVVNAAGTAATCRAPANGSQACSTDNTVAPACDINQGELCVNGSCRTVSWSRPGSSCTAPAQCDAFGTCNPTTSSCDQRPNLGQSCAVETCAPGFFCDPATSRCAGPKTAGAACASSAECATGLICGGAQGNTTCQAWSWQACAGGGPTSCTTSAQCGSGQACLDPASLQTCAGAGCQCFDTCDAFASTPSCGGSSVCQWNGTTGAASGACVSDAGGGTQGAACTASFDANGQQTGSTCNATRNFFCAGARPSSTSGVCTRICAAGTNALCGAVQTGLVCDSVGMAAVGICRQAPPAHTDIGSSCTSNAGCQGGLCSSTLGGLCSASCGGIASCATGSICVDDGAALVCARECSPGAAGDMACAALNMGSTCVALGTTGLGVCADVTP